ncbi:MAG: NAD-dependent epimerase/dehydratase family protein [Thermodesulfobacteriota bacterium]
MKVLVTGAEGFVAKNLIVRLGELDNIEVVKFSRQTPEKDLSALVADIDAVVHLAGVNRPQSPDEFATGNAGLTENLCQALVNCGRQVPVILPSSIQATLDNPYGNSKRAAENAVWRYAEQTGASVYVYRLPNVFGKWCKPNYNSAVATFCHNIARGISIKVNDGNAVLKLVYVDDVVDDFLRMLQTLPPVVVGELCRVPVEYTTTVGAVAELIETFRNSRTTLVSAPVGTGLMRALYATYVSYFPPAAFAYEVPKYEDPRGVFVEMLKTKDSGQFSYFTAHPGVTRGGHYHHSKTEKFLVIKGSARFDFRQILTNETYEILTSGETPQVVETVPGWSHNITNVGDTEMIVMLWANEIFDRAHPDTITCKV